MVRLLETAAGKSGGDNLMGLFMVPGPGLSLGSEVGIRLSRIPKIPFVLLFL